MKIKLLLGLSFILLTGFSNVFAVGLPDGAECCNSSECESGFCECSPSDDCARKNDGTVKGNSGICGPNGAVICPFSKYTNLESILKSIINTLFLLAVVLCPLMIIIGGFLMLTSAGDPNKTALGKDFIKWAVIGLVVILASKLLFNTIKNVFSVRD